MDGGRDVVRDVGDGVGVVPADAALAAGPDGRGGEHPAVGDAAGEPAEDAAGPEAGVREGVSVSATVRPVDELRGVPEGASADR